MLASSIFVAALISGPTQHELALAAKAQVVHRRDQLLSPRPYRGVLPGADLGYAARGRHNTHVVSLSFAMGSLRSGPDFEYERAGELRSTEPSLATMLDLRYAYGRRLAGERWSVSLGATLPVHIEAMNWVYGPLGNFNYLGVFALGPWAQLRLEPAARHLIELELGAPIVAWVARSPYALNDDDFIAANADHAPGKAAFRLIGQGRFESLDTYQSVDLRGSWAFALHERWALVSTLGFWFAHESKPRPLSALHFSAMFGARGSF
ncbi:MAG: hypothetical protein R6X02_10845 [Enhygromyxa sp.]